MREYGAQQNLDGPRQGKWQAAVIKIAGQQVYR